MYRLEQIKSIFFVIFLASFLYHIDASHLTSQCDYSLVESVPEELTSSQQLSSVIRPTHEVLLDLINEAKETIKIACFYIQLTPSQDEFAILTSAEPGRSVLKALEIAMNERHVKVEILLGMDGPGWTNQNDLVRLTEAGADIHVFDVQSLTGGVQHAKYVLVDGSSFYLGSANMDWRSLTQVQELGIHYKNCHQLANDLDKIFQSWIMIADSKTVPELLPPELQTDINKESPLTMIMDNSPTNVYLGASPKKFSGEGNKRTDDIEALVATLANAEKFAYISVMKFSPYVFKGPRWPLIENAMKRAADRGVDVKLIIAKSQFKNHALANYKYLNSYKSKQSGTIEVKTLSIPTENPILKKIPHARVNHGKYIVTDNSVYLGTSNFEQSYFTNTCGVSISITPSTGMRDGNIVDHVKQVFERDYFSNYAENIPN